MSEAVWQWEGGKRVVAADMGLTGFMILEEDQGVTE